jgi:hypothetical protein
MAPSGPAIAKFAKLPVMFTFTVLVIIFPFWISGVVAEALVILEHSDVIYLNML